MENIFIADLETITINTKYFQKNNDTGLICFGLWNLYGDEKFYGVNFDEFFKIIIDEKIDIIYFHNLSWDGAFIRAYLQQNNFVFNEEERNLHKNEYYFLSNNHKIYYIKVKIGKRIIKFKCSYLILSVSISQLGKNFNLDKYENAENENFYDLEPVKKFDDLPINFINYLKRDIEIMKLSIINFENTLKKLDMTNKFNLHKYYTIARISLYFQSLYAKFWNNINNNKFFIKPLQYTEFKNLMSGGFSSFNVSMQAQEITADIKGYDINSSYPSSMTEELPLNEIYKVKNNSFRQKGYIYFFKIKVYSAFSNDENVFIMKNWNNKVYKTRYVEFIKNVDVWYFEDEWELIKKHYDIKFRILETYKVKSENYLKNYIETAYKMRLDNKEYKQSIKILLNSSFGVHAKKISYNNLVKNYEIGDTFTQVVKKNKFYSYEKKFEVFSKNINSNEFETLYNAKNINELELPDAPNILLGAYITMKSRVKLIKFMEKIGFENCIYWDTDSVYFKNNDNILNKIKKSLDDTKLGYWKLEKNLIKMYIKGSKSYFMENEKGEKDGAFSGLNKRWLNKNMEIETFKNDDKLINATLPKKYTKSGIVLIEKDYKVNKRSY